MAAVDSTQGCLFERAEQHTDRLWTVQAGPWAKSKEYVVLDLLGLAAQVRDALSVFKHHHLAPTYALWGFVVEHYTQCKLTKPQDKLVAISDIAKLFQASLPADTYLAGLWKNDLAYGLLWRSATYKPSPLVRVPHRAPSWSWASVDGKILAEGRKYVMSDEAVFVKVVSAQTILRTPDPTAQVVAGTLTLTGMLFDATFEERFPRRNNSGGNTQTNDPCPHGSDYQWIHLPRHGTPQRIFAEDLLLISRSMSSSGDTRTFCVD